MKSPKEISLPDMEIWIAQLISCDGVVSPTEKKIVKAFSKMYGANYKRIIKLATNLTKNIDIPEVAPVRKNEAKGRIFENLIVSFLADKSVFKLLAWRSDKIVDKTYPLETKLPDLHVSHKIKGRLVRYYLECKYRSSWKEEGLDISKNIKNSYSYAKKYSKELFIVLGVGGSPDYPEDFMIIPAAVLLQNPCVKRENYIPYSCYPSAASFRAYLEHSLTTPE